MVFPRRKVRAEVLSASSTRRRWLNFFPDVSRLATFGLRLRREQRVLFSDLFFKEH
jgi:hypothetical protein